MATKKMDDERVGSGTRPARVPYETPRLTVHGDMATLTKQLGTVGHGDNGAAENNTKTKV